MRLQDKKCIPCEGGTPPLEEFEAKKYLSLLHHDWRIVDNKKIRRELGFKNFLRAMVFVNNVAEIAEKENHHPDIYIFYNKVIIELWTHVVGGLSENDFIVAAKIDELIR